MIDNFRHRGLKRFYERGEERGLNPQHIEKIRLILTTLDAALTVEAMDLPSFRLHRLTGDMQHFWSVTVRSNWRIVFRFEDGMASDVDLVDYH